MVTLSYLLRLLQLAYDLNLLTNIKPMRGAIFLCVHKVLERDALVLGLILVVLNVYTLADLGKADPFFLGASASWVVQNAV